MAQVDKSIYTENKESNDSGTINNMKRVKWFYELHRDCVSTEEFFTLGSQEGPTALELLEHPCEEYSKKKHRYKCSGTGMPQGVFHRPKGQCAWARKEGEE